jgi:hypothetical protein
VEPILHFALRFDGYAHAGGRDHGVQRVQQVTNDWLVRWQRSGELPESLDQLRLVLFGEERRYKWTDIDGGDPENMPFIRAVVGPIRQLAISS